MNALDTTGGDGNTRKQKDVKSWKRKVHYAVMKIQEVEAQGESSKV